MRCPASRNSMKFANFLTSHASQVVIISPPDDLTTQRSLRDFLNFREVTKSTSNDYLDTFSLKPSFNPTWQFKYTFCGKGWPGVLLFDARIHRIRPIISRTCVDVQHRTKINPCFAPQGLDCLDWKTTALHTLCLGTKVGGRARH